ncbi:MAG: hypothetical protein KGL57_12795 [Burkholderiales bacterium]|nr:hypothetical protein [Burkholderiales bacterium]
MPQVHSADTALPAPPLVSSQPGSQRFTTWRLGPWMPGALLLMGVTLWLLWPGVDVPSVRAVIRATARTSLFFFLMAYTAQAVWQNWPNAWTAWSRQHRRQWGLLLVTSHGIHLVGILVFLHLDPVGFHARVPAITIYSGTVAYVFLALMGLSSNDTVARWMGRVVWSRLHTWGSHYLWLSFLVAFGKRIPQSAIYWVPVALLMAALLLRKRTVHPSLQL